MDKLNNNKQSDSIKYSEYKWNKINDVELKTTMNIFYDEDFYRKFIGVD